jgi:pimeloyl-ACP methyl ester carboxylesterase
MLTNDLVVVLPGIMGSTLTRHGKPVWSPAAGTVVRAICTFGNNIRDLRLPSGLGDEHPDDGIEPAALFPDLHIIPGLWTPVRGYDTLLKRLRRLGYGEKIGNLLPVPYDWRLSNRYNGQRLATIIEPALGRWRESAPENRDAQLVIVCHSMGGLVARWFLEKCGGADVTRKLITLGTPYRGAAKAISQLVNGVRPGIGPLSFDLTDFARSMPSLYQLLPSYACVEQDKGLRHITDVGLPELDSGMVTDALTFHHDLTEAEAARPASLDITHAIVGVRQVTPTSVRIAHGQVETLNTIEGDNDYGDATVPLTGAIGHDLPMDSNTVRRIVDHHGNIQANPYALDEVEEAITAKPIRRRAPVTVPVNLTVPDLVLVGEQLPITVQTDPDIRDGILVTVTDERERSVFARQLRPKAGTVTTATGVLAPGAYEVKVTGTHDGSPITPVTAFVLVWDPAITPQQEGSVDSVPRTRS